MHHVIYVPGLGDAQSRFQPFVLDLWRFYGLKTHYFVVHWQGGDDETYTKKLERLVVAIDQFSDGQDQVSLVAVSAGASLALNAFALRKKSIKNVVLICGKVQNMRTISSLTYIRNPAFKGAMEQLPKSLASLKSDELARITSIRPLSDRIVPPHDTKIFGTKYQTSFTLGHVYTIAYRISLGSPMLSRILKR